MELDTGQQVVELWDECPLEPVEYPLPTMMISPMGPKLQSPYTGVRLSLMLTHCQN